MVDMRNDGGPANPLPTDNNEESRSQRFTAVNNGGGNGGLTVVSHRPQLPPIVSQPQAMRDAGSNGSASTVNSAEEWRQGGRSGSVEMSGSSQKRKRSPDISNQQQRAITPTTQATHHHLAAHEAAMAEENTANAHHTNHHRNQASLGPDDRTVTYSVDEEMKGNDDGRTRSGTQDGTPPPGTAGGDPKKRKRVFSNRTKTGCITCRRRKKKCDEGKPECSNCKRGGFVCEGYSGKINWQKPPGKSGNTGTAPVSIQSKTEQPESTSASPTPIHISSMVPKQLQHRPEEIRRTYPSVAPIVIDEAKPEDTIPSMRQQHVSSYSNEQQPPSSSHQSYTPVQQQQQLPQQQQHQQTTPMPSAPISNHNTPVPMAAIPPTGGPTHPRQRSEKEKMLSSELYQANAPELVEERERCKGACIRFNNASDPNVGVSKIETGRLLLEVLRPGEKWAVMMQNTQGAPPKYVNEKGSPCDIVDVKIDAPFTCSYGYNIRLGKDVHIEYGCTILDSCTVTIKSRTIISPNVSIFSATHPIDPRKRNGAQGPEIANPVIIEEDCWIGGNTIVLSGITIGKGSVVGAGSVVTKDVPPFTIVAGNPARVVRGIYQNGIDM